MAIRNLRLDIGEERLPEFLCATAAGSEQKMEILVRFPGSVEPE